MNQHHELHGRGDVIAHLNAQHHWAEPSVVGVLRADELLAIHRELHELQRLDEKARERYARRLIP